jgi:hypothetical protein
MIASRRILSALTREGILALYRNIEEQTLNIPGFTLWLN